MSAARRAEERVRDAGGPELFERLLHLDALRKSASLPRAIAPAAPERGARVDVDVAIAGGGLSVILAPALASLGIKVAVFDRARAASAHREWNASGPELDALVRANVLSSKELDDMILARYREGVCTFHRGGRYPVRGVLDHAVDAGALLRVARAKAEALGVRFYDGHAVVAEQSGPDAARLRTRDSSGNEADFVASVLVDARGAASPYLAADLTCPTVGGVFRGLEIDPQVGEILATTGPAEAGRQHVWEAFPGRPGETTVYLFYYAKAAQSGSLMELYAKLFEDLPSYKRGGIDLLRPTFGFIPGWSRLTPPPCSPGPRIVLVGDAAARHSPLTYCGFGAMLRSVGPATRAIAAAVELGPRASIDREALAHDAPIHGMTGALARLLAGETMKGDAPNALLDAAFGTLHEMGNEAYASLLQDAMSPDEFVEFLRKTAAKRGRVYLDVVRGLGPRLTARWGASVGRSILGGG